MLDEEYVRLMSDKTKFIAFIDLHKQKAAKIKEGSAKAKVIITQHGEFRSHDGAHL
jgi:kinetochore protein NDC80